MQATPYFAYSLNRWLAPEPMKLSALDDAKAIVLLGGGVSNNAGEYSVNAISGTDTLVRIRYTAFLEKRVPELPIFVSGGAIDTKDSEASLMRNALVDEFDVENPVYLEPDSKTTQENARYTARLLQQYGISRVILVSSASHLRRASALFERNGIQVIPAPTGFYSLGFASLPIMWFIPTGYALATTATVLHEFFGYFYDVGI